MPLPRTLARDLAAAPADRLIEAARASRQPLWLVGGRLRDAILGRAGKPELDFAAADPRALIAAFRRARGEAVVELDAARDTFRVVAAPGARAAHVDLARLRAPTIEGDLGRRDFTVNALALELGGDGAILDPTGGTKDCRRRVLRACGPRSIADDPLRALRAVRLAAALGLAIDPGTLRLVARGRRALSRVSAERVRDELFEILGGPRPREGIALALRLGLLARVGIAAGGRTGTVPLLPSSRCRLPGLARAHRVVGGTGRRGAFGAALAEPLELGVDRGRIALLAALLRDLGLDGHATRIAGRCVLGAKSARALGAAAAVRVPPGWYRDPARAGREGLLALHDAAGEAWAEAIAAGAPSPAAAAALARRHLAARRAFARPALLDGAAAMRELGLAPGPSLGALLAAVRRAQDLGAIRTSAGARHWSARHLAAARQSRKRARPARAAAAKTLYFGLRRRP